ncbi:condensation domain-containing protein [Nonomuraea sp. NPDC049400]|uniref:condensation domain-containing protein n=1 Tax=Nonomuraea sp. NPDC049400 TaxID=3364352 RepID=UPI0037AD277D
MASAMDDISLQEESWLRSLTGQPLGSPIPLTVCWELTGELNRSALLAALRTLAARHDVLRRYYPSGNSAATTRETQLRFMVLDDLDPVEMHAALNERFIRREPPLWRVALASDNTLRHLLGLSFDKLVMDAGSVAWLLRDLTVLYTAACGGPEPAALRQARPYAEFATVQREALHGSWGEQRRQWWRATRQTNGQYPPRWPIASGTDLDGTTVMFERRLPDGVASELASAAARRGVTEFALVAGAVLQAFEETTGLSHSGLVTNGHGRCQPGYWRSVGLFAHGIPVFCDASGRGHAESVQHHLIDTIEHALPLRVVNGIWQEDLVDVSSPPTCVLTARTGHSRHDDLRLAGLDVRLVDLNRAVPSPINTRPGVTCFIDWVHPTDESAYLTAEYNAGVYPRDGMEEALNRVYALLTVEPSHTPRRVPWSQHDRDAGVRSAT